MSWHVNEIPYFFIMKQLIINTESKDNMKLIQLQSLVAM